MRQPWIRTSALVTLAAFAPACAVHTTRLVREPSTLRAAAHLQIAEVVTRSGELIRFRPAAVLAEGEIRARGSWTKWNVTVLDPAAVERIEWGPGRRRAVVHTREGRVYRATRVLEDSPTRLELVEGEGRPQQEPATVTLPVQSRGDLTWVVDQRGLTLRTRAGLEYVVTKVLSDEQDSLRFEGYPVTLRLPLSEVRQVRTRHLDRPGTLAVSGLALAGGWVGLLGLLALTFRWSTWR